MTNLQPDEAYEIWRALSSILWERKHRTIVTSGTVAVVDTDYVEEPAGILFYDLEDDEFSWEGEEEEPYVIGSYTIEYKNKTVEIVLEKD